MTIQECHDDCILYGLAHYSCMPTYADVYCYNAFPCNIFHGILLDSKHSSFLLLLGDTRCLQSHSMRQTQQSLHNSLRYDMHGCVHAEGGEEEGKKRKAEAQVPASPHTLPGPARVLTSGAKRRQSPDPNEVKSARVSSSPPSQLMAMLHYY